MRLEATHLALPDAVPQRERFAGGAREPREAVVAPNVDELWTVQEAVERYAS